MMADLNDCKLGNVFLILSSNSVERVQPRCCSGKEFACQCEIDVARDVSSIPGLGRALGVGSGNHSSSLAWKISWTEKCGRLQSMELQRVRQD